MHNNQQLQALCEHCKALEMQILKVMAERNTVTYVLVYDAAFQTLTNAVHIPVTDPLQFVSKPTPISPKCDPHRPNAQTHSKVRFWNKSDYLDWLDSLEATSSDHRKLPFLEDEIGNPISEAVVEAICKSLWGAWSELATHNLAPSSWGKLTASRTQLVNSIMETKRSDDNNNGNENEKPSSSKGKKQQYHVKHEAPTKKMKVDTTDVTLPPTPALSLTPEQVPAHLSPTRSLKDKENTPTIPAPKSIKVVNPLVALTAAAAQISFPPLPPISESTPTNTSDSMKASTSKAPKLEARQRCARSPLEMDATCAHRTGSSN
ncbi:hypothetical protein DEU56DRAFT_916192 [Suillus clintonianus]|uniref:uncharacterized protein n=1 Tax=Suillus clintonianus TaxID=1904413 RepID=UPI001B85FC2B|nr:uncharacterized protein DEU56DRAFT_916192 [Suillus clintonianus]KAG2126043.1 hypothetical protein DEU56DRAFT_916192 [Suillus clintonianus]